MEHYEVLNNIDSIEDVKKLDIDKLNILCEDIRHFLIYYISKTGGHLASNLGAIEITLAMHYVFNSPLDKIIFDVGHQCYTHKIITGRKKLFNTIKSQGGISGFPKPSESEHDSFIAGHSSTSVSAGLGISRAVSALNKDDYTIAFIGDGAFTAGMVYEALNNISKKDKKLIIIFNNNDMSISKNVGSFAKYINNIRSRSTYYKFKKGFEKTLDTIPFLGKPLKKTIIFSKTILKDIIYHSNFFEDMGFHYIGPLDGHNLNDLISALKYAKTLNKAVFIHIETIKGKGYRHAEKNPTEYHGVSKFDIETGNPDVNSGDSFSDVFGKTIKDLATKNKNIFAITAAMEDGTGLQYFRSQHPDRFFDVGIAEQHAVTFCAGLACSGMLPVFAVYSTFLQRAYDQVIHDLAIDSKKVILCIDRAGVVGDDGETHQGIFDVCFLSCVPNITIFSPCRYDELILCLNEAVKESMSGVIAIRYPKGKDDGSLNDRNLNIDYSYESSGSDILIISYGRIFKNVINCVKSLSDKGIKVSTLQLVKLKPISEKVFDVAKVYKKVYFFEEGIKIGGIAQQFFQSLYESGFRGLYKTIAIDDQFISQASVEQILKGLSLDTNSMVNIVLQGEKFDGQ